VSAEIIQFISLPNPRGVSRSAFRPDDLTMDHADTAPCEYARRCEEATLTVLGGATRQKPAVDRSEPGADESETDEMPEFQVLA
jgi:hypothetical protein